MPEQLHDTLVVELRLLLDRSVVGGGHVGYEEEVLESYLVGHHVAFLLLVLADDVEAFQDLLLR